MKRLHGMPAGQARQQLIDTTVVGHSPCCSGTELTILQAIRCVAFLDASTAAHHQLHVLAGWAGAQLYEGQRGLSDHVIQAQIALAEQVCKHTQSVLGGKFASTVDSSPFHSAG